MTRPPPPREARIVESRVSTTATCSVFTLTLDVSGGPVRDLLFEIVKNRRYAIEPAENGRALIIRDLSDLMEPVTFSNGITWIPREVLE